MASLAAGSPSTIRSLKKNDRKGLTTKRLKGKDGKVEEIDIDVKFHTCEKGSDECEKIVKKGTEVTKDEFEKVLADKMLLELEEDDEEGKKKKKGERELWQSNCWYCYCDWSGRCYCVWVCDYA